MKKAEIKELGSKELQERLDAAVAALNQLEITHSISPLDSPAKITGFQQQDGKNDHGDREVERKTPDLW